MTSSPPNPAPVTEAQLPDELRSALRRARALHDGVTLPPPGGLALPDGSIWIADGGEVSLSSLDDLRKGIPGLGVMLALGVAIYTYSLFDAGAAERWAFAAATLVAILLAALLGWRATTSGQRAAAKMNLGTLLLDHWLVVVSRNRFLAIPRRDVLRHELAQVGTSNRIATHSVRYRTPAGPAVQALSGFSHDPQAVAVLQHWIESSST